LGYGETLQELVEIENVEGLGRLYCDTGQTKWKKVKVRKHYAGCIAMQACQSGRKQKG
jgi:hypothetical protein